MWCKISLVGGERRGIPDRHEPIGWWRAITQKKSIHLQKKHTMTTTTAAQIPTTTSTPTAAASAAAFQTSLPIELIQNIFQRINPNHVLKFKRLCTRIFTALSDPHFAVLNLREFSNIGTVACVQSYRLWFVWPDSYQKHYAGATLKALFELKCGWKAIQGCIPKAIGGLTNLTHLNLHENRLTGEIPSELCKLTNLQFLHLNGNRLTGAIPKEIGNLTQLQQLYLQNNRLSSKIPDEIGDLVLLEALYLNNNALEEEIPKSIGKLSKLKSLYLEHNQLKGEIPVEIGLLQNLQILYLGMNDFEQFVPSDFNHESRVFEILHHQGFRGRS
ncbi:hypothetical protein BDR26DRAFT_817010 [Obelidium mucronatum]|nr:hypothetical protein BDR26DRAFT_817010 [Obelidium mucronatum]